MRRLVLCLVLAFAAAAPAFADRAPTGHAEPEGGRSGFWTSRRPAVGGAYRYRLLGIGAALVLATGLVMLRLVKRASAERAARGRG